MSGKEEKTAVVMPEDVWFKLCAKQCRARCKKYGGTRIECVNDHDFGVCPECAEDAIAAAPAKYRTTPAVAARYDLLPGCDS